MSAELGVEGKVREMDRLRAKCKQLEDGMRQMRLGGDAELRFKDLWWRGMVIAGGWSTQKAEPLPAGMSREFYEFLGEKMTAVGREINALDASLKALGPDAAVGAE